MIGELEGEGLAGQSGKQHLMVAPIEVHNAAVLGKRLAAVAVVQDLVVVGGAGDIGEAHPFQGGGHLQSLAGDRLVELVTGLGDVEVAHQDDVLVEDMLAQPPLVDPVGQVLQGDGALLYRFSPAHVGRQQGEIEIPGGERGHVGRTPPGELGLVVALLVAALGAPFPRRVRFGRQSGEHRHAFVVEVPDALSVAGGIGSRVAEHDLPEGAEDIHDFAEIGEVVPQFDQGDQIELVEDLGDHVDRLRRPRTLAEVADVPGRDIEAFIQFRRRDLRRVDPLAQDFQLFSQIRRDIAVKHCDALPSTPMTAGHRTGGSRGILRQDTRAMQTNSP